MELRLLNTFITVAKLNNFTQAAEQLNYAQSSVTSQIQMLESELGVRLFERLGKSISLTPEGERLLPYAKQILKLCDDARCAVSPTGVLIGTLTIGAPESLCAVRLLPLYTEFHNRFSDVELSLKFGGSYQFLGMLKENQIDVAFYIDRNLNSSELVSLLDWPEPIILLAAPSHPLAHAMGVTPADLADQLLILTEAGCSYRNRLLKILSDSGITPKSMLDSESNQLMKQLAMSGLGIAFLPKVAALDELAEGKLVELPWIGPAFDMNTYVVYHKDKWISPEIRAFITLAKELLLPTLLL